MASLKDILEKKRSLLKVHIETSFYDGDIDLYEELSFETENLLDHVEAQAGMVSWYSTLHRIAEQELSKLERRYDLWWTPRYEKEYRRLWRELGETKSNKPNISSVENAVKMKYKTKYVIYQEEIDKSKLQVAILKDVVSWWTEKGRMLFQAAKFAAIDFDSSDFHQYLREKDSNRATAKINQRLKSQESKRRRQNGDRRVKRK